MMLERLPPGTPSLDDLAGAAQTFQENEGRDLFYRVATEIIALAIDGKTTITVSEGLAVLLQTWNQTYYRFHPGRRATLSKDLGTLLGRHKAILAALRTRSIASFGDEDEEEIGIVFASFADVLGPVGTAKALHLLAPFFFPLWDDAIAHAYHLGQPRPQKNAQRYIHFMRITQSQVRELGGVPGVGRNPLKALDEFNYCRYSRGWF